MALQVAPLEIVGWSLADSMDAQATTIAAWEKACTRRRPLFNYSEVWYNRKRLHSSLDYRTPAQTEELLIQQTVAA